MSYKQQYLSGAKNLSDADLQKKIKDLEKLWDANSTARVASGSNLTSFQVDPAKPRDPAKADNLVLEGQEIKRDLVMLNSELDLREKVKSLGTRATNAEKAKKIL